jgi:4-amino-4-deoxy-L-arabinose transferase-like glycosyltransferase
LAAFGLRLWQLDGVPPGWRDDELINSLVISQHVLDGEWAVYYADASGHEALYHVLNAAFLGLFGATVWGIRYLSVLLGTLTIPFTYLLGKKLFGPTDRCHFDEENEEKSIACKEISPAGGNDTCAETQLSGSIVGLVAAAGLAVSFWALIYSRIGLRHILLPLLALAAFYFFWRGFETKNQRTRPEPVEGSKIKDWHSAFRQSSIFNLSIFNLSIFNLSIFNLSIFNLSIFNLSLSALFTGLGFYTYFAGRGVPLILLAFVVYAALFAWERVRQQWRGLLLMAALMVVLALPLTLTLRQQPESEARVAELAVPLTAARQGDFRPLAGHAAITLGMFFNRGDGEWLYNIPDRPALTGVAALFFWLGVGITAVYTLRPLWRKLTHWRQKQPASHTELAFAFLLIWWLAGISPAFISVPPASLGHTILAQPAVFMLTAVPLWWLGRRMQAAKRGRRVAVTAVLGVILVGSIALRDWPAYFVAWPQRGMVRFLYRADLHELAGYVNDHPDLTDFGVTSLLAGPWDQLALNSDLREETAVRPRWFNPERAALLNPPLSFTGYPETAVAYPDYFAPTGVQVGGYTLSAAQAPPAPAEEICFENGLCLVTAVYHPEQ